MTGATGVVGSAVITRLLAEPDTTVCVLIRAEDDAMLQARVVELARFAGVGDSTEPGRRLVALRGDVTVAEFGLGADQYESLVRNTTHIVHSAGTVRMNLSLDKARRSAVGSATEILALANRGVEAGALQKVEFISTVGIAGKRAGTLTENWIDEPCGYHNTYEQAKAEAETLVRSEIATTRLPVTVHRPSMVVGDSRDGRAIHFQIFYFICEFLTGRKTFGFYPDFGETRLDLIPCDHVANAIVAASKDPATSGRIFHLCSGDEATPLEALRARVTEEFAMHGMWVPRPRRLSSSRFAALVRAGARFAPSRLRRALDTLPVYLEYLADRQSFGNAEFRAWATQAKVDLAAPESYLRPVLRYYLQSRFPR